MPSGCRPKWGNASNVYATKPPQLWLIFVAASSGKTCVIWRCNGGAPAAFQFSKVPQEAIMAKDEKPSEDLSTMAGQTMKQARGAMENYLDFFQKSMSASPWAGTELSKKMTD